MDKSDSTPSLPVPAPLSPKKENITPDGSKIAELNEWRAELLNKIQGLKQVQMTEQPQLKIPASDHFHGEGTCLSRFGVIDHIKEKLTATQVDMLRQSCFGHFLSLEGLHHSPIVIHYMMLHEIHVDSSDNDMWFYVGRQVIRFSRMEFGLITGLRCGHYPVVDLPERTRLVDEYFGSNKVITLDDIETVYNKLDFSTIPDLDAVRLSLFYMLERFLLGRGGRARADLWLLRMTEDLLQFNQYPWGSVVFQYTILSLRHIIASQYIRYQNDVAGLDETGQSYKGKYNIVGMPIAFQVWIYESVPSLHNHLVIKVGNDIPRIRRWRTRKGHISLQSVHKHLFSKSKDLLVLPMLELEPVELANPCISELFQIFEPQGQYEGNLFVRTVAARPKARVARDATSTAAISRAPASQDVSPTTFSPSSTQYPPPPYYTPAVPLRFSPLQPHYSPTPPSQYSPASPSHYSPAPQPHYSSVPPSQNSPTPSPHLSSGSPAHFSHESSPHFHSSDAHRSSFNDDFRRSVTDRFDALTANIQAFRQECVNNFGRVEDKVNALTADMQAFRQECMDNFVRVENKVDAMTNDICSVLQLFTQAQGSTQPQLSPTDSPVQRVSGDVQVNVQHRRLTVRQEGQEGRFGRTLRKGPYSKSPSNVWPHFQ